MVMKNSKLKLVMPIFAGLLLAKGAIAQGKQPTEGEVLAKIAAYQKGCVERDFSGRVLEKLSAKVDYARTNDERIAAINATGRGTREFVLGVKDEQLECLRDAVERNTRDISVSVVGKMWQDGEGKITDYSVGNVFIDKKTDGAEYKTRLTSNTYGGNGKETIDAGFNTIFHISTDDARVVTERDGTQVNPQVKGAKGTKVPAKITKPAPKAPVKITPKKTSPQIKNGKKINRVQEK
jgi:hypothetical protein